MTPNWNNVHRWTISDVGKWLKTISAKPSEIKIFKEQEIDGVSLFRLNDKLLKSFGIEAFGARDRLLTAIHFLRSQPHPLANVTNTNTVIPTPRRTWLSTKQSQPSTHHTTNTYMTHSRRTENPSRRANKQHPSDVEMHIFTSPDVHQGMHIALFTYAYVCHIHLDGFIHRDAAGRAQ